MDFVVCDVAGRCFVGCSWLAVFLVDVRRVLSWHSTVPVSAIGLEWIVHRHVAECTDPYRTFLQAADICACVGRKAVAETIAVVVGVVVVVRTVAGFGVIAATASKCCTLATALASGEL